MDMDQDLLEGWKKFRLTKEEEETSVDIDRRASEDIRFCLVGKLLSSRIISIDVIRNMCKIAWKLDDEGLKVEHFGKTNHFVFTFDGETDCVRISKQGPWFFDTFLMVLEKPMPFARPSELKFTHVAFWVHFLDLPRECFNPQTAERIGNAIGVFEDVDGRNMGCWGESLRVRIRIDVTKPLRRVLKISLDGASMDRGWFPIKYERLPEFCGHCGIIGHNFKDCVGPFSEINGNDQQMGHYGLCLRYNENASVAAPATTTLITPVRNVITAEDLKVNNVHSIRELNETNEEEDQKKAMISADILKSTAELKEIGKQKKRKPRPLGKEEHEPHVPLGVYFQKKEVRPFWDRSK